MNRRTFLIGSLLAISMSCMPKTYIYYADGKNDYENVKKEISENKEKIIDTEYNKSTGIYIIKTKGK
jgi:hypothetical protein